MNNRIGFIRQSASDHTRHILWVDGILAASESFLRLCIADDDESTDGNRKFLVHRGNSPRIAVFMRGGCYLQQPYKVL